MRDSYGIKFSFDDKDLSRLKVTADQHFSSPEKALDFFLQPFSYKFKKIDGVYVIYNAPVSIGQPLIVTAPKEIFRLSGLVTDMMSGEPLPYAFIRVNGAGVACDERGRFTAISDKDSIFTLSVRYLGYVIKDTLVAAGSQCRFRLIPSDTQMREVVVPARIERGLHTAEIPGSIKVNNLMVNQFSGSGNSSAFSFLRLMPGVLASGEQTQNLIIWGGYEGHSQVTFDGITLFGLKNFSDNISAVNPYIVKDVKLLKGGYSARYGNRVGGLSEVTCIDGNRYKREIKADLSNLTLNVMASTPVGKKASVVAAFRQTFYNVFAPGALNPFSSSDKPGGSGDTTQIYLYPQYNFHDMNLKFSGSGRGEDSYAVSLYGGEDVYKYSLNQVVRSRAVSVDVKQDSRQFGGNAVYHKVWNSGDRSSFSVSYSTLDVDAHEDSKSETPARKNSAVQTITRLTERANTIEEIKFASENRVTLSSAHSLIFGTGITSNYYLYRDAVTDFSANLKKKRSNIAHLFLMDQLALSNHFVLIPGLRADYSLQNNNLCLQPRLSAKWQITDAFKLAASWGMYNQFVAKNIVVGSAGSYHQIWMLCQDSLIPTIRSRHWVSGVYFEQKGFSASLEAFHRLTTGLSRIYLTAPARSGETSTAQTDRRISPVSQLPVALSEKYETGSSRAYGIDVLIKQQYLNHYAWLSYSWSKTDELFTNQTSYQPAPQDQRHELKGALLLNFRPFTVSTNYVYGSGFPVYDSQMRVSDASRKRYSRWDISGAYHFRWKKSNWQTGISIQNLLNSDNLKFSEFVQDPSQDLSQPNNFTIFTKSIPFTPMAFLEVSF